MSKLDDIVEAYPAMGWDNDYSPELGQAQKEKIKTLILDLFKEVEYDPFEFVAKVKEL